MITRKNLFLFAFALSLLVHILALYLLTHLRPPMSADAKKPQDAIEVMMEDIPDLSIADIAKPAVEKRPEKARHVGMYDSSVKEEKVAQSEPRPSGRPVTRGGAGAEKVKELSKKPPQASSTPPKLNLKLRQNEQYEFIPGDGSLENKKLAMNENAVAPPRSGSFKKDLGEGLAGHVPDDFFPNYKRGDRTYLNVLRQPGIDYYVRLKRIFKMTWDPVPTLRAHINEVSKGTIQVVVGVTIDASGNLAQNFVLKPSGMPSYDHEALRAVKASAPFSSPPAALLKNGELSMSWTFVVYM